MKKYIFNSHTNNQEPFQIDYPKNLQVIDETELYFYINRRNNKNDKFNFFLSSRNLNNNLKQSPFIPNGVWITGAPLLWRQGYEGDGVTVGIIDSGIDPSHPDLQNVKKRKTFVGDDEYINLHYHGTHVAGIIGANGSIKGIAPNVNLHDYRVFDANGKSRVGAVEEAIVQGVNDGCQILNLSFGSSVGNDNLLKAVNYAINNNVLIVAAAGNENKDVITYPAFYPSVLSVSSVDYNIKNGKIVIPNKESSNLESGIDICSDGFNVLSTIPSNDGVGRYALLSGTSMSCPHVSGFSALLYSKVNYLIKNSGHKVCDLHSITKTHTLPLYINSNNQEIANMTGAGLATIYPEIPSKLDKGSTNYFLSHLNLFAPPLNGN